MFRIFKNTTKKATTALIENTELDAILHIGKQFKDKLFIDENDYEMIDGELYYQYDEIPFAESALMNSTYRGTVVCNEVDTYDIKVGESKAVKKAMNNHNRAFKRAILRWQVEMLKKVMEVSPESFELAVKKVLKN